ncbi:hypothetical protein [Sphingomonas phyllosphaerae]|uniref:hypothetical protein n=1 Tax=Sphingomonas phyllosphaerae TaxID=257003 RepID=UPI00048DA4F3|nr:hypothetical protein [Sphingomonas phyllosphaerae]
MKIFIDESHAGAGKTGEAIDRIVRAKGKVLFVTERRETFYELETRMRAAADAAKTRPIICHIHSENHSGRGVASRIAALPGDYRPVDHVIVIITHEALLRSDFKGFAGWQIVIDEVPRFLDFQEKRTALDAAFFQQHYELTPFGGKWHTVTLTPTGRALTVPDVRADQSHTHLDLFHARVIEASQPGPKRHVLCSLPDWTDMSDKTVAWCWASVFSLRSLDAFDRVELLGNRFRDDIGATISAFFDTDEIEWECLPAPINSAQPRARSVSIHYFSDRPSAKGWFGEDAGQAVLREVGLHLSTVLPNAAIWTTNNAGRPGKPSPRELLALPDKGYLTPKQAGTNEYRGLHHAAIIYAAKPCANLRSLLDLLDIDSNHWTRSVEFEAVLQFVTRTSIRDPNSTAPVSLWVFDREQALYLKEYFDSLPHVTASLVRIPLAIEIPEKQKGGRKPIIRTPEQREVAKAKEREKDAARKRESRKNKAVSVSSPSCLNS